MALDRFHRRTGGFTAVELVIVAAIVGILAAAAIPTLSGLMRFVRFYTTSDLIKGTIRTAKSRAISNPNVHCGVYFRLTSPQAICAFYDNGAFSNRNRFKEGDDAVYLPWEKMPRDIALELPASNPLTDSCFVFRGDGSARSGGTILLRNTKNPSRYREINVLASTGRVKVTNY